jgi:hypothetical protein
LKQKTTLREALNSLAQEELVKSSDVDITPPSLDGWEDEFITALDEALDKMRDGPDHYNFGEVQPIDLIRAQKLSFCEGNVVKYVCRYRHKGGMEDLKKAMDYLQWVIEDHEEH